MAALERWLQYAKIGGVACRRSEVANITVAASALSWLQVQLAGGLTNPQVVPGSQVGFPWGLSYSGHYRQANLY